MQKIMAELAAQKEKAATDGEGRAGVRRGSVADVMKPLEEQERGEDGHRGADAVLATEGQQEEYLPSLHGCRSVEAYTKLNAIAEGTYGKVYRARSNDTGRIVALKQIKMGKVPLRVPTLV